MNPYLITGPALISFSGGRTSAYMLKKICDAHGGKLPDDVKVAFANTGKEREETLRFVHEVEVRWGIRVHWLEFVSRSGPAADRFQEVGFNSAARDGEPFQRLIEQKQRLPNWDERWCTEYLKVRTISLFAESLGWELGAYTEVIGLRDDEGHRILKSLNNAHFRWDRKLKKESARTPPRLVAHPLAKAKVVKADIMAFWRDQPFDLGLEPWEGNCDLCFLKGRGIKKRILRERPEVASWWAGNETRYKGKQERGWFDRRDSVAGLVEEIRRSPDMFDDADDLEFDAECGLVCASGA